MDGRLAVELLAAAVHDDVHDNGVVNLLEDREEDGDEQQVKGGANQRIGGGVVNPEGRARGGEEENCDGACGTVGL